MARDRRSRIFGRGNAGTLASLYKSEPNVCGSSCFPDTQDRADARFEEQFARRFASKA